METDQEAQLDALLNQPAKPFNKNQEVQEMDASIMLKREKSPSPIDNKGTQTAIVIPEKIDCQSNIDMTSEAYGVKVTVESKSIVSPQKVASANVISVKQQLEKMQPFTWSG